jgi:hypothetical protein
MYFGCSSRNLHLSLPAFSATLGFLGFSIFFGLSLVWHHEPVSIHGPSTARDREIDHATNAIGSVSSRSSLDSLVLPPPPPPSPWRVAAIKIQEILTPSFL